MSLVLQEEIDNVRNCLQDMPLTSEALGVEWITANILNVEERTKKHSLFWLLWYADRSSKLESWLAVLKTSLPDTKFRKIITSLKEKNGENEFGSFIPEIEVLAYYASKKDNGVSVEYEPNIPNKNNVGDIKLSFGGKEVYLEVTKLFSSKKERKIDALLHLLGSKIDEIVDNPFYISIGIEESFAENDVMPFVESVQSQVDKYKHIQEIPADRIPKFDYNSKGFFMILMRAPTGKKGHAGGFFTPAMELTTAGRLKGKIKDKVKQLPDNQLNVVALDISHHFAHFDDIEDAFAGQEGVRINVGTGEVTPYRNANGIIHIDEGKQIGLIIGFKGFDYENRRKYVNLSATVPFSDEMVSIL
jgi:hypothetical protein